MIFEVRVWGFGLATVILVYISRASLLNPHSHGFYRFFAWEFIVALFLLNVPIWFSNWLSWHQIISWSLLTICVVPLVLGLRGLQIRGQPDPKSRTDPQPLAFENTTRLVTDGIFANIRHPMYSSLLLLAWGLFFKSISVFGTILVASATLSILLTAKMDEVECLEVFGKEYREYMRHTRMFIPRIL